MSVWEWVIFAGTLVAILGLFGLLGEWQTARWCARFRAGTRRRRARMRRRHQAHMRRLHAIVATIEAHSRAMQERLEGDRERRHG